MLLFLQSDRRILRSYNRRRVNFYIINPNIIEEKREPRMIEAYDEMVEYR